MTLPPFSYACPESLEAAVRMLAGGGGEARPLAGGQSLIAMMALRLATPGSLVDLRKIPELRGISINAGGVRLGAMVRWREIEEHRALAVACPLLKEAVGHIAHYQIRNKGTLGGSLGHADPAAEFAGVAVACEAVVEIASPKGTRELPVAALFIGPLQTCLADDDLIVAVRFPPWREGRRWAFEEFSRRQGDFALAAIAVWYNVAASGAVENAHISVIGATDAVRRLAAAEAALNGRPLDEAAIGASAAAAAAAVNPSDDIHGSADYRRSLVETLLSRALRRTVAGAP